MKNISLTLSPPDASSLPSHPKKQIENLFVHMGLMIFPSPSPLTPSYSTVREVFSSHFPEKALYTFVSQHINNGAKAQVWLSPRLKLLLPTTPETQSSNLGILKRRMHPSFLLPLCSYEY